MDITKFFSRKRPSNDADDEVPPPKSSAPTIPQQDELKGAEGQDSCHNQASNPSKAEKDSCINLILATKKSGRRHTHGYTAIIPRMECFVVCAKTLEGRQLLLEVLGLSKE